MKPIVVVQGCLTKDITSIFSKLDGSPDHIEFEVACASQYIDETDVRRKTVDFVQCVLYHDLKNMLIQGKKNRLILITGTLNIKKSAQIRPMMLSQVQVKSVQFLS